MRCCSALRTSLSTSTGTGANGGTSAGSRRSAQKSGMSGLKMSVRSASSAVSIWASARMAASARVASSASASMMSMGGVVPISTRERVLRSDSRASSSDWRATSSDAMAKTRSAYAVRTPRVVIATFCRRPRSVISRLVSLVSSCRRALSMPKPRRSGWR